MIVHEAASTFVAVYHTLIGWLTFFTTVGSILIVAAVACGARGGRAAWGWLSGRLSASERLKVPNLHPEAHKPPDARTVPRRTTPSWARTDHHYEEAA